MKYKLLKPVGAAGIVFPAGAIIVPDDGDLKVEIEGGALRSLPFLIYKGIKRLIDTNDTEYIEVLQEVNED